MESVKVRRKNPAAEIIRDISSSRKVVPKDVVLACEKTGAHLGVISIKCDGDASLQDRISSILRDYDVVYQSKGVVQVFAPVIERGDMQRVCSRVLDLASNRKIYVTYIEDPKDIFEYSAKTDSVDMVELVLGRERKEGEQVHLSVNDPSKDAVLSYLKTLHGVHPGLLGKDVKVVFVEGSDFQYIRSLSGTDEWRMLHGKSKGQLEDLSFMLEGNDFVVYNIAGKAVQYDEKRKTIRDKDTDT